MTEDEGVRVVRYRHFIPRRQDALRRLVYELTWAAQAFAGAARSRPDVVIAVVPALFTGPIAIAIARLRRSAVGIIVQDAMTSAASQSGILGGQAVSSLASAVEKFSLRRSDGVVAIHERLATLANECRPPVSPAVIISNWSHGTVSFGADRALTRAQLGWTDSFVVLHSGNMGLKQDLEKVLHAAALSERHGYNIRFVLAGGGSQFESLREQSSGRANVEVLASVPAAEFADFLAASDVLLVHERAGMSDMSLPSKLTSYFLAGRPVLAATESDSATATVMSESGAGVVVPPANAAAVLDAIVGLMNDEDLSVYGVNALAYAAREMASQPALEAYERWIKGIAIR